MLKDEMIKALKDNGVEIIEDQHSMLIKFTSDSFISVHYNGISIKAGNFSHFFNIEKFFSSKLSIRNYDSFVKLTFYFNDVNYDFNYNIHFGNKNDPIYTNVLFNTIFSYLQIKHQEIKRVVEQKEFNF